MCIIGYDSLGNTAEFLLLEDYYLNPQIKIDDQHGELSAGTDENLEQMQEFTSASSTSPIDASKPTCTKEDTRYTPQYTLLSERIKIPISCYSNSQNESQSFKCSACGSTCQKCFSRDSSMRHKDVTSERLKEMKVNGNY